MSKTIDEKVVSMQFDNSRFESNVKTSIGTLDRLKQALKLENSSKSLENIGAAAKRVDMSPLSNGIETVRAKFSALDVMAATALANITNSAVNAGKRLVSAFTIEPVKTGFQEYELKMGSIQTIMAGTGESLETVNEYLNELNTYSDKTIYSFKDMTSNIGKFTNAGVKLDDAVLAIKGVSNEAALSGANANEASRAMYNFAQALSAGYVKLIDWKSIELANMATKDFKQQLIDTAVEVGTLTKTTDGYKTSAGTVINATKNFNDSLQDQWMTTDVLINTLKDYADETTDIGKKAYAAAQDVKTFSMMMDTLKEAAQSGWAQTWEIVVGDFEESKNLWTKLADTLGSALGRSAENRNSILDQALTSNWDKLIKKIGEAGVEADDFESTLKKVLNTNGHDVDKLVEKYGSLGKAFASGDLKDGPAMLKEAINGITENLADLSLVKDDLEIGETGDDIKQAQKALKDLGYDLGTFGEKADGLDGIFGKVTKSAVEAFQAANNLKVTGIVDQATLTALKEASSSTKKITENFDELISKVTKSGGRDNLITALNNSLENIKKILGSIKEAWNKVFYPDATSEDDIIAIKAERLYEITEAIKELSEYLKFNNDDIKKLVQTFTGLFSVLKIIRIIVGGPLSLGLKILGTIIGNLDLSILDITSAVGNAITKFADWLATNNVFTRGVSAVASVIMKACKAIKEFVSAFLKMPGVQAAIANLKSGFGKIFEGIGKYFADGAKVFSDFIKRVKELDGLSLDNIRKAFKDFKDNVLGYFLNIDFSFEGIKNVIKKFKDSIWENLTLAGEKFGWAKDKMTEFVDFVREKIPAAIAIGMGAILIKSITKLADVVEFLAKPFGGIAKILGAIALGLTNIGKAAVKYINAKAFRARAAGIKDLAMSILIVAAAIAILTKLDQSKMWGAVGAIAAIAVVIAGLSLVVSKIKVTDTVKISAIGTMILKIGAAMLILVWVMKIISKMSVADLAKGISVVTLLGGIITGLVAASKLAGKGIDKVGPMMLKVSVALLVMALAVKLAGSMEPGDIVKGTLAIALMGGLVVGLVAMSKLAGKDINKVGGTILKISVALLLMLFVAKLAGSLNPEDIARGILVISAMELLILGIIAASKLAGQYSNKAGTAVLRISLGLIAMVSAIKIAAKISVEDIKKGLAVIAALEIMMAGIIAVSKLAGANSAKAGAMLLMMAGSLLILTGVIYLLKDIDPKELKNAVAAIAVLELLFAGLIAVTHLAKDCKATLIILTVAIGLLAGSIFMLSKIDNASLTAASNALSKIIIAFGLLVASTKLITTVKWGKTLATLGGMVLVVGTLAGILIVLSKLEVNNTLEVATSLTMLLLALAATCKILDGVKVSAKTVGSAALMALVIGEIAVILGLMSYFDIEPSLETCIGLSALLLAVSGACTIMATIPISMAVKGAVGLVAFVAIIGAFIAALGGLSKIPGFNELMAGGGKVLGLIGQAIGNFIGGILGGIAEGVSSALPGIGQNLSDFMINAQPFFDNLKNIDAESLESVKTLASMMAVLAGANILEGFAEFFTGKNSMDVFASQLTAFGDAIVAYSETVSGNIDADAITASAEAGKMLADLAGSVPRSGPLIDFLGSKDLGTFGSQLKAFGDAIVAYSQAVSAEGAINTEAISVSVEAGNMLSALATTIPSSGLVPWIVGQKDMGLFGSQLELFGKGITAYSRAVSEEGAINTESISVSIEAANMLVQLASTIPDSGFIPWITGQKNLATFGIQLAYFGQGITAYSNAVSEYPMNVEAIRVSVDAANTLADLATKIPDSGLIPWISGQKNLSTFGTQLASFGKAIVSYSEKVADIDVGAVETSVKAVDSIVKILGKIPEDKEESLGIFKSNIKDLGGALDSYSDKVSDLDTDGITNATISCRQLIGLMQTMSGVESGGVSNFSTALETLGNTSVDAFVSAFENVGPKVLNAVNSMFTSMNAAFVSRFGALNQTTIKMVVKIASSINSRRGDFMEAGVKLITGLSDGIKSGTGRVRSALTVVINIAMASLSLFQSRFYTAGMNMVQGFANGIELNTFVAQAAASAMAEAAIQAAKDTLAENSPSKVFEEIGKYSVEGLAKGLTENAKVAGKASEHMGATVLNAVRTYLGIHSPSLVFNKEVGRYIVQGIAEGIKIDTSAEDAAKKKADNIVEAFKTELDKLDLDTTTVDLEYQLAEKLGKTSGEQNMLVSKMQIQAKKVQLAQNEYQETISTFGASSEETQESYNKLLKQQIELADLSSKVDTAQKNIVQQNQTAQTDYYAYLRDNADTLLELGFTMEEIQAEAARTSGFNANGILGDTQQDISKSVETALSDVQNIYSESTQNTLGQLITNFSDLGLSYVTAVGDGFVSGGPNFVMVACTEIKNWIGSLMGQQVEWFDLGAYFVDGFIQGIQSNIERAAQEAAAMAEAAMAAAQGVISGGLSDSSTSTSVVEYKLPSGTIRNVGSGVSVGSSISLSDVQFGARSTVSLSKPVNSLSSIMADTQNKIQASNQKVSNSIDGLREDLESLKETIGGQETALYVDSKKLASSIAKPMNRQLNILSKREAYT